jgi:hypothetical protein
LITARRPRADESFASNGLDEPQVRLPAQKVAEDIRQLPTGLISPQDVIESSMVLWSARNYDLYWLAPANPHLGARQLAKQRLMRPLGHF